MECLRSMITFDPTTIAYRSTGSVPVPLRKGSNPAQNNYNRNNKGGVKSKRASCPALPCTLSGPAHNYSLQYQLKLSHASQTSLEQPGDTLEDLTASRTRLCHPVTLRHVTEAVLRPRVCRTHVEGRAVTRTPDVVKEMRRGSMKERWGLELVYRLLDAVTLEIAVTKVSRPSAAHAAGLSPGHVITAVNQWNVEAMQVAESIHSVLGAGGFFLTLGWLHQTLDTEDGTWAHLGAF